jgi:glycerophosphoryl diester phosphodiesterase
MNTSKQNSSAASLIFDVQGHRGCRGLMPENTIPAMLKAIDLGVTTLEMDVVITKDKQVILSHEPFFNHEITTKPNGSFVTESEEKQLNIYAMNYSVAKTYDVGLKPHPRFPQQKKMAAIKPTLADVIDSVEAYCTSKNFQVPFYNIETKSKPETDGIFHPAPSAFIDLIMDVITSKNIEKRVIIQSFDIRTLQYLHIKYPFIKTSLLVENPVKKSLEDQFIELGFKPTIYSPDYLLVTKKILSYCKKEGIKVSPWTVNKASEINRLMKLGVDGIITDFPDMIKEAEAKSN